MRTGWTSPANSLVASGVPRSRAYPQALAGFQRNREYRAPWEPIRPEEFYTVAGQQEMIDRRRAELEAGTAIPMVAETDSGPEEGRP